MASSSRTAFGLVSCPATAKLPSRRHLEPLSPAAPSEGGGGRVAADVGGGQLSPHHLTLEAACTASPPPLTLSLEISTNGLHRRKVVRVWWSSPPFQDCPCGPCCGSVGTESGRERGPSVGEERPRGLRSPLPDGLPGHRRSGCASWGFELLNSLKPNDPAPDTRPTVPSPGVRSHS